MRELLKNRTVRIIGDVLVAALLLGAIVFGLVVDHGTASRTVDAPVSTTHKITEDDPAWDCHTMGNHVCGTPRPNL